jgi:hypothetical protein
VACFSSGQCRASSPFFALSSRGGFSELGLLFWIRAYSNKVQAMAWTVASNPSKKKIRISRALSSSES